MHILRRGSDAVIDAGPASKEAVAATVWDVIQDVLPAPIDSPGTVSQQPLH